MTRQQIILTDITYDPLENENITGLYCYTDGKVRGTLLAGNFKAKLGKATCEGDKSDSVRIRSSKLSL